MIKQRLARLRALLARNNYDALLVSLPANRRYLSGFMPDDTQIGESSGHLFISRSGAYLLTDFRYQLTALQQAGYFQTVIYTRGLAASLAQLIREMRVKTLAVEADALLAHHLSLLQQALPEVKWESTAGFVSELRVFKDAIEVAALEQSARLMERVLKPIMNGPLVGRSEREVALEIVWAIEDAGGEGPSFPPIVASGPNSAEPHAEPGPRVIAEGEIVLFDVGAKLLGYCSDISRTVIAGGQEKADAQFRRIYSVVREAQLESIDLAMPGMLGKELDDVARRIIDDAGFRGHFGHALGHGVGLATHEAPSIGPRSEDMLEPGMVFTIEPGIYLPGWGGVRLEVMVVMEDEGVRVLGAGDGFYDLG